MLRGAEGLGLKHRRRTDRLFALSEDLPLVSCISRKGVVIEAGSTNATYLSEAPLTDPQPLHPGDRIRIGDWEFSYAD
jgi:pSer/pThr/pTyr-binding forkhead associated (FHA) protein